jgi:glycosyltransferase involved in cell wall biosynthesis
MPVVSVVMSVYNGEKYLAEAVESILAQTFTDFEFVIVDDGSKDKTAEILAGYAKRDSRVRVITQENTGRSEALNNGFKVSGAPLIARMDADDIALPKRFEEQCQFMREHTEVGLLGGQAERIAPDSRSLGPYCPLPTADADIRQGMLRLNMFIHPSVMMRRELAVKLGGFRKALPEAEDYDLFVRISEHAQVANLPNRLLRYRMHANQASVRAMGLQAQCCLAVKAAAALRKRGLPDPLEGATQFGPELLRRLGVTEEDERREELHFCANLVGILRNFDTEMALQLVDRAVSLRGSQTRYSSTAATALMEAASIWYRRGKLARALVYGGRALLAHPGTVGQHLRLAAARRAHAAAQVER